MIYNEYRYIYPPRPEKKINPVDLDKYDNGEFIAEPKCNGDACVMAIKDEVIVSNRHNELKNRVYGRLDLLSLSEICNNWMVLCGEMLDKAKKDEDGEIVKGVVIWDILVYDGKYLIGSTLKERIDLLDNLFPSRRMAVTEQGMKQYKHLLFTQFAGIYKVPVYTGNFTELYNDLVKTDLYEGLVLKKINAKLEVGFNSKNNAGWQLKVRKPTKIYQF